MASVPALEFQKNFSEWRDRSALGPVEITEAGQPTAYLVSPELFQTLWQRMRAAIPIETLTEDDIDLVNRATVVTDKPYNLEDLPDLEEGAGTAISLPRQR